MTPIKFKEQTAIATKDQPEYNPLPVHIDKDEYGSVTACWKMSFRERIKVLFTGRVWVSLACFGNPITPSKVSVDKPKF